MNVSLINTCCFIGHREIEKTKELENKLYEIIEDLILNKQVDTFLFGSMSQFNDLCYLVVSNLKEKYSNIKRIYVRGEYQYVSDKYKDKYFLNGYEDTYLPKRCEIGSKASYIERNYEMIDNSKYCVFYYDENYVPKQKVLSNKRVFKMYSSKTSGTKLAYDYAVRKYKIVLNVKS